MQRCGEQDLQPPEGQRRGRRATCLCWSSEMDRSNGYFGDGTLTMYRVFDRCRIVPAVALAALCVAAPLFAQDVSQQASSKPEVPGKFVSGLVSSERPADAPPPEALSTEDLVRAVKDSDLAPPNPDPRNFNGVWFPDSGYGEGPHEEPQYLPGKEPQSIQLANNEAVASPSVFCIPGPRFQGAEGGMVDLYLQTPKELVLFAEENTDRRQIFIGSEHPQNLQPSVTGHSAAHWDGDTLVVDTVGIIRQEDLQRGVRTPSTQHVVEHIRKVRGGHYLEHQITYEDPSQLVKPYTTTWGERWRPDMNINENVCEEAFDRFQVVNGRIITTNTQPTQRE